MKITNVEPIIVNHQLNESFYFSQGEYSKRTVCLVKITTDSGSYGWGEGYGPAFLVKTGIEFFTPLIIGKDPLQQENLWQTMYLRSLDFARSGILVSSLSAIDVALWDLKGKILNQPVSVLLGGRKREQVRAYATGMYFSKDANLSKRMSNEALNFKNQGFEAMKMKVGLGIKEDIENVCAVRQAIGPDIELMVDADHAYSLKEAIQLAYGMEKYNISWFEQPINPQDYNGYREIRGRTSIPIAAGEIEFLRAGFLNLFQNRSVDIVQPDICAAGGITEMKKIGSLTQAFGVEMVPHCWGTGIAISAALQFLSNWDITPGRLHEPELLLEFDQTENPLRDKLVDPKFVFKNGRLSIPDKPGLGVDINEKELEKYRITNK
jgi:D-galactarolactone cycloisomerase